jgi:hypothetical protein
MSIRQLYILFPTAFIVVNAVILTIGIASCKRRSDQLKRLDIQAFERQQSDGVRQYTNPQGAQVLIQKVDKEYWQDSTEKDDYFTHSCHYYLSGHLKLIGMYFHDGGFAKGIWIDYHPNGKVIKTEDHDAPYKKYPWNEVLAYLKKSQVNLLDKLTRITNASSNNGTFWYLSWKTGKINADGFDIIKNVKSNANSGRITPKKDTYCCMD